jgi:hypothetical protein
MKCTQCGSKKFKSIDVLDRSGDKIMNVDAHVCLHCGHVEWFVGESRLAQLNKQIIDNIEKEKTIEAQRLMKKEMLDKRARLLEIINDENQSVKSVNAAQAEVEKIDKALSGPFGYRTPSKYE